MATLLQNRDWLTNELQHAAFGDERLDQRFQILMQDFLKHPNAPINQASADGAKTKAAYRFLQNGLVVPAKILHSHGMRTAERAAGEEKVLVVQDTSTVSFFHHPATSELGHVGSHPGRADLAGLFVHSAYVLTSSGSPLGLVHQHIWARGKVHSDGGNARTVRLKKQTHSSKESYRWSEALEASRTAISRKTDVISVCDREADIFEFLQASLALSASFVVRAKSERKVEVGKDGERCLLSEVFLDSKPITTITVEVAGNGQRQSREVKLALYAREVTLLPPPRAKKVMAKDGELLPLPATAVWAVQEKACEEETPVSWLLLTDMPVRTAAEVKEKVFWYSQRWRIEDFHKTLKSGCKIEDCRLATGPRLANYIASMSIVAHRLLELTYTQRHMPEAPCTAVFADDEWRCLHLRIKDGPLPKTAPTLKEAVAWLAQLGGHLGRNNDPPPGVTVLWRGWTLLAESVAMYRALNDVGLS
jgi:hypothetical protein